MIKVTGICMLLCSQVSILALKVTFARVSLSVEPFAMMTLYAGIRPQVLCNLIAAVRGCARACSAY